MPRLTQQEKDRLEQERQAREDRKHRARESICASFDVCDLCGTHGFCGHIDTNHDPEHEYDPINVCKACYVGILDI